MLTADEVRRQLGLSKQIVANMRKERRLFGLTNGARSVRFPRWQFEPRIYDNLQALLTALEGMDCWAVYLFLVQKNALLDDFSPLEILRAGEANRAVAAARSFAEAMA
jgi:hypothetical protein